jgi:hypothetical protein
VSTEFVDFVSERLERGVSPVLALREWVEDDGLGKTLVGTVDFLDDTVKVFTINGQFTRSPTGANVIEFTMGANWYGGTKKGTYWPICEEDEVVLHELMPPVDMMATLVHELVERHMMKYGGYGYDEAHSLFAEPLEKAARRILESEEWGK